MRFIKISIVSGLALAGLAGTADAAKMTKTTYATGMMAAKAEAARRFNAAPNIRIVFGKTGRAGLSATRLGKDTYKVSYPAAFAGTATTIVKTVSKADGIHAYSAKKVTIEEL